jgi:hypothetical protein
MSIQHVNDKVLADTKKKINALNTILLQKYEEKQNIDSKILKIVINKLNSLSSKVESTDQDLQIEINNLKKTLTYLQEQQTLFYNFDEEST